MHYPTSPWYSKPSPSSNELQQPPSEETIFDNGTNSTKKRKTRKLNIYTLVGIPFLTVVMILMIFYFLYPPGNHAPTASSAPAFSTSTNNEVSFPTNPPFVGDASDFIPYRVPTAFPVYPAVPTEGHK
ncbi:MAG: hypothetical protein Q9226_008129 [Calogaya cf. arnoldii]